MMSDIQQSIEELDAVLHWRGKHARALAARDALQLRLNAADQRIDGLDELLRECLNVVRFGEDFDLPVTTMGRIESALKNASQTEPVNWAAPKTVRQLIRQLQTLDPDLETHAMLRIPDFKDGKQVRSCPLSISYERMEGPWLSSYKGDGRKVIAIWAKPDPRELQDQGETLTESAESR